MAKSTVKNSSYRWLQEISGISEFSTQGWRCSGKQGAAIIEWNKTRIFIEDNIQ